jgi:hypothetical protein
VVLSCSEPPTNVLYRFATVNCPFTKFTLAIEHSYMTIILRALLAMENDDFAKLINHYRYFGVSEKAK